MSFLPASIESLFLSGSDKIVASSELTLLSELCPKLVCLDIRRFFTESARIG